MYTSFDKALAGAVMGVLFILSNVFGITLGFTEAQVTATLSLITPILIWLIPNKKKEPVDLGEGN